MEEKRKYAKRNRNKTCSVGCKIKNDENISFHRFPRDIELRNQWMSLLKIKGSYAQCMRVCGKHFHPFAFLPRHSQRIRVTLKKNILPLPVEEKNDLNENAHDINQETMDSSIIIKTEPETIDEVPQDVSEMSEFFEVKLENISEDTQNIQISHALETTTCKPEEQLIRDVQCCNRETQTKSSIINDFFKTDEELHAYTGINFQLLRSLITCVSTLEVDMEKKEDYSLDAKERITLTLMKLKLNLSYACLSVFFKISLSQCKNYFIATLMKLSLVLESIIQWPSKNEILNNIPKWFEKYRDTRVVLNCTEIAIQKKICRKCRSATYSKHKCRHTMKFIIGTTPSGSISFISKAFGGSTSNKQIVVNSKILEKLLPNIDSVMVDKSFNMEAECARHGIKLIRPTLSRCRRQLSKTEAEESVDIVAAYEHIKRDIRSIKRFRILREPLPRYLVKLGRQIMIVTSGIVNLSKAILSADKS